ncbi:hypothetical protein GCM10009799_47490 [Nocardiopsis rhodophaea]|uniref:Uncharacterized protein n=1 Tax=Nocardiopsis rhodophaea TaxID=280238 RepID=A0ABP5F2Z5_9ACTN
MSAEGSEAKKLLDELANIEFNAGSDIAKWATKMRLILKALSMELEYGAQEIEARLSEVPAPEGSSGVVVARKAKSVGRHARRSAEAARKSAVEVVRTWASVERQFDYVLAPQTKRKKPIDLSK